MSTVHAGIAQPKPLPVPNSDFCELAGTLNAEELAVVKQVRAFMERRVAPIINKYWATTPSVRAVARAEGAEEHRRTWPSGVRLQRRKPEAFWLRRDGDGTRRLLVLHLLRRPQHPGDGLHPPAAA